MSFLNQFHKESMKRYEFEKNAILLKFKLTLNIVSKKNA